MANEELKAMLEELSQQVNKVNETIKAFNAAKGEQQILRVECGVLFPKPQVHCEQMESVLEYTNSEKRKSRFFPEEKSVVMDGVKFFELVRVI